MVCPRAHSCQVSVKDKEKAIVQSKPGLPPPTVNWAKDYLLGWHSLPEEASQRVTWLRAWQVIKVSCRLFEESVGKVLTVEGQWGGCPWFGGEVMSCKRWINSTPVLSPSWWWCFLARVHSHMSCPSAPGGMLQTCQQSPFRLCCMLWSE